MLATTKIDRFIFIAVLFTCIHNMINNKAENIIGLGIITIVFLLAFSVIISQQIVSAQQKQASSSGNVTAQVAPQGTSLNASKGTTATPNNTPSSSSGNVTASVKPQGTSLQQSTNQTSATGAGQNTTGHR
jgi:hypothetical protein